MPVAAWLIATAVIIASSSVRIHLSGYQLVRQHHIETCEAAAAAMALHQIVTDNQIMARMPRSDDPWLGFRGSLDRYSYVSNDLVDYGVYAPPLAHTLDAMGFQSRWFQGAQGPALLIYSLTVLHRPVVVWVTWELTPQPEVGITTAAGHHLTLVHWEHANLIVGYDRQGVSVYDPDVYPYGGIFRFSWGAFLADWQHYFNNMGLIVDTHLPPSLPAGFLR